MSTSNLPRDQRGFPIQALAPNPAAVVSVAIGAASARVAFPAGVTAGDVVRVAANNKCFIKFGTVAVVATGTDSLFPIGTELFKIPDGCTDLAVIQDGAVTGLVTITQMV